MGEARTALITGGGTGIGAAVARRLSRGGIRVALLGRNPFPLQEVRREIEEAGGPEPLVVPAHQESDEEVAAAVGIVEDAFGRIDILFNNAAVYEAGSACETSIEDWDRMLAVNLRGPILLSRAVVPIQRRNRGGVIINNASTLGLRPVAGYAAYSVSKAALVMLTRCLAAEEGANGIRVVAICPGVVDTPIHARRPEGKDAFLREVARSQPLGRVGTPDDLAELVEFLASSKASWITGTVVTIDGGLSLE